MNKEPRAVGVIGASSFVGEELISKLAISYDQVVAFSRKRMSIKKKNIKWRSLNDGATPVRTASELDTISYWICVAPIWVLPHYFFLLESYRAKRIIILSSTSLFTKSNSSDNGEQKLARKLKSSEKKIQDWSNNHNINYIILRPTLIYGLGFDKNISEVARFIHKFKFSSCSWPSTRASSTCSCC